MNKLHDKHKIIILTVTAVLAILLGDTAFDAFISREGTFLELLTNIRDYEPFLRLVLVIGFLIFGFLVGSFVKKREQSEERIKRHSAAIENSMDGIAIYNAEDEYVFVNQAYASINGYDSPQEIIGKTCRSNYGDHEYERMQVAVVPVLQRSGRWRGELIGRRKNGSTYFQEASVSMMDDGSRVCIIRDITWRKRSEERVYRAERFLNTIFNSIRDPFCIFDDEFRIIRVNDAYAHLKNKTAAELIGRKCYEVLEGRPNTCEACVVGKTFHSADPCAKDKSVSLKDGTQVWMEIYTYPIQDDDGRVTHVIEYTRDITERKKSEEEKRRLIERLEYLSRTDSLTGLMNRRALTDSLSYELDRAKRYESDLSLILCDIDNFKEINDSYGHDAGDRALQMLSATLKTALRKTDIAGRYGGDEFMLVLPETTLNGAEFLAEKILAEIRNLDLRFRDGRLIRMSTSIGVACLSGKNETIDALIKRADDAMYSSKQAGRDRVSTNPA